MINGQQQQGTVPFQGGGGFGGGAMSGMGFGQFGGDPMSVNNNMMALGQQQVQWSNMMTQMSNIRVVLQVTSP